MIREELYLMGITILWGVVGMNLLYMGAPPFVYAMAFAAFAFLAACFLWRSDRDGEKRNGGIP